MIKAHNYEWTTLKYKYNFTFRESNGAFENHME